MRGRKKLMAMACAVCVLGGGVLPAQISVPAAVQDQDPALEQISVEEEQLPAAEDQEQPDDSDSSAEDQEQPDDSDSSAEDGWLEEPDGRSRFYENGVPLTSQWIGEYYVDGDGYRVTDTWIEIDGDTYHFAENGVKDVKKMIDDRYVDKNGRMITKEWKKVGKYYYYFAKDGVCKKDSWVDKKTYYVNAQGRRITNKWKKIGDYTYHFAKNGKKDTNKWIGNRYVDGKGREVKGIIKGAWEGNRFRKSDGSYASGGSYNINGTYYLFNNDGYRVSANGLVTVNDIAYYCLPDGRVKTNAWVKVKFPIPASPASAKKYWTEFNENRKDGFWAGEDGQFVFTKHKTIKWDKEYIEVGTEEYPEHKYYLEPLDKSKPAYYQWMLVKKKSNTTAMNRPIHKIKKKGRVVEAFGIGDKDNPWCLQTYNCKVTKTPF